ncbi:unnamed protein product [Coccothraustes coccothraustes]
MASGLPKKTPTPRLLVRERLKPSTLLPSKFQREKFPSRKKEASTGGSILPRIGPFLDRSETRPKLPSTAPKQSWFGVSPPEMVFQNFVAGEVSEMVLSLINKDKIPWLVKVSMESCPYFQLACPRDVYHVVPAGASAPVRIRFSPAENKDYCHELVCMTARERIVVPIRAIGARAVLDFPGQLDFSKCAVKCSTQQTLLLRNVGARAARYQLSTQSPFSVVPATGALGAGDTVQVTVGFHPRASGDHCGSLAVSSSTGEEIIHTKLHGEAVEVNVGLSTNSVEVDKTFITMSSHRTVFIENRSNITAHFQWKAFPSEEEENEEKRRLVGKMHFSEIHGPRVKLTCGLRGPLFPKVIHPLFSLSSFKSMVQQKMAKVPEDPMLFSHDIFSIEPVEGEIGPNCLAEIKVTFKPLEALEYGSVAYCSISGRESRLPLQLRGEGQGPLVELSSQTLDLGNVCVNSPHICEVKLMNQGALDAPFTCIPSATNMGSCFKFAPEEGIIAAGGSQAVQISFSATVLGSFEEEFQFRVAGSPTPAILTIKGSVTVPSLHFDLPELDFGDISFGFPYTQRCRLTNSSPVPLRFQLRMSDDGTQPAVDSVDQIRRHSDPAWRKGIHFYVEPREFTMNPSQGTILPQGHQDIEVTLCSNTVMEFRRGMLVDLEGIGKGVAKVIITASWCLFAFQLLPSKFQREKFPSRKKEASTGGSILPRIGPFLDRSETRPKLPSTAPKQSWFGVSPPEMVFQNFVAGEVSEMVLSLINKDKIPWLVKVSMESCPYFQLACPRDVYHVVPAGASAPVRIRFSPAENKDYCHELVCMTARERIVVPIRAIGARAVLDFPGQLDFSKCAVKCSTQQTLLLRNVGARAARYQLSTQSPFSVVPATGALGAGDTVQVTVGFHPRASGDHCGSLAVSSSTGEEIIHTKLHGEAVEVNVGLSTNSVEVDKTFITMSSHRTVFIENRSNITAHFQWKAFPSEEEENEEKRRLVGKMHFSEIHGPRVKLTCGLRGPLFPKVIHPLFSLSSFKSMVQQKMAKVPEDPMLFSHDIFSIEPVEGEIGPNCLAEIKVTFKPLEALEYGSVAYCSISGRESRLPLQLRGEGQGPLVELSSQTLDLGNVCVNSPHICEVKLMNQGALDAPFTCIPSATNMGSCFKFAPEEGIIAAGGSQAVQISFSATVLGSFEEEFQFRVAGSPTPAILTIKGSVTVPSLHFDLPELDFGDISFGFPYTQRCRLTNSSPVPLRFQLRMSDDGTQPAVDSVDQIRRHSDPAWRKGIHFYVEPREFTMNPSQGTILPQGHQDIEVTLCSNTVMEFRRGMLVDLEGIGKGVAKVIITASWCLFAFQLLPSKFQREKFPSRKKEASTGGSILPRIGPFLDRSETRPKLPSTAPKQSWFGVSPPEMVFQNFVAGEVSEMVLSLINKDKIPWLVKVSMESCPYFQLACPRDVYHVVPAGASAPVRIRFSPAENKDYCHELVCMTARERIVVPIRAIGARAVLDFPGQLDFSKCAVKCSTQQTLLLRNVGARAARYQLSTQSPFSVVPATGALGAGDTVQVTVGFHPRASGDHCGSLAVSSSTGEEIIHTKLHGEAVEVNVGLSTNSVEVDKTFITMSSHRTVFIENRSNITAHFQWKAFPSEEEENEEKRRLVGKMHFSEIHGPRVKLTCGLRGVSFKSMVQQKMAKVPEDPMLFSHDIFSIEPVEGEIGPNCLAEIKVTFKPLEALEYGSVAYCSISGRESRLPLQLRGEGQGPLVELSSQTLDLGNVCVNSPHICEVKLMNQGALDAPFTCIPSATNMGSCFKFAPEEGIIAAGGSQAVQISFSATVLGSFEEEFQFRVAGSPTPAILTIKGSVTVPSLHFDLPELDFGDISFGFPYTQRCRLTNSSPVPLRFQLRMSDDGTQPAVDSVDQIRRHSDPAWRKGIHFYVEPREFTMNPSQGTILPQGHQDIEVTLCSNTVMEFRRGMLVDLEGIGKGVAKVIITARCLVPELQVSPYVLQYDECHLKVPYERKLVIRNPSHLPGCYGLIPQPQSTAEIPVVVEVQALGEHRTNVLIGVFGDERNPLVLTTLYQFLVL